MDATGDFGLLPAARRIDREFSHRPHLTRRQGRDPGLTGCDDWNRWGAIECL